MREFEPGAEHGHPRFCATPDMSPRLAVLGVFTAEPCCRVDRSPREKGIYYNDERESSYVNVEKVSATGLLTS